MNDLARKKLGCCLAVESLDRKTCRYVFTLRPDAYVVVKRFRDASVWTVKIWTGTTLAATRSTWRTTVQFFPSEEELDIARSHILEARNLLRGWDFGQSE